ncbi:MAG: hypothetical protein IPH28_13585 [Cytophagaceae bacterium]|nr:hypothetical protein [Cytophagaceae bacterium]MBK9511577.1 hypothetical protein [Cytophagaceae bacterium]MBK9932961.1 hypothetical protein [Cytophagaceae bacterium]MBL0303326.1 hypothetical protein [Cytophagaceae bacterium]MBL0326176.1 hypothetical protein [Cytophagaceae bacterium]
MTNIAFGQATLSVGVNFTLPSVSLLDIAPDRSTFSLSFNAPTEAGNQITTTSTNNTKWLNFTSAVPPSVTRKITASISGAMPGGVNLNLAVASVSGAGAGTRGTSAGTVVLSNSPQAIVNNIGGAYTGNGANNGYMLTFTLGIGNFSLLRNQTSNVTIVYTLVDN